MSELGKKSSISNEGIVESNGAYAIGCSSLCETGAVVLCKCKNNKKANKGSSYYSKRNSNAASNRVPTGM